MFVKIGSRAHFKTGCSCTIALALGEALYEEIYKKACDWISQGTVIVSQHKVKKYWNKQLEIYEQNLKGKEIETKSKSTEKS